MSISKKISIAFMLIVIGILIHIDTDLILDKYFFDPRSQCSPSMSYDACTFYITFYAQRK